MNLEGYFEKLSSEGEGFYGNPAQWSYFVVGSLALAARYSNYRETSLFINMYQQYLEKIKEYHSSEKSAEYDNKQLVAAVSAFEQFDKLQPECMYLQDRVLRWLVSKPDISGHQSLSDWVRMVDHYTLKPKYFSGDFEWSSIPEPVSARKKLADLIGLNEVKLEIDQLESLLSVQKERESRNIPVERPASHLVFTGNPGTGKTTVARIVSQIYRELGYLTKGHLIETDRSGLVGSYVGHTEEKTARVVESAIGGVLFIDEAYGLVNDAEGDFGTVAINTLLPLMENRRDDLVVIAAGYTDEMDRFLDSNPGLRGRFSGTIRFSDYTDIELRLMLQKLVESEQFIVAEEVLDQALKYLSTVRLRSGSRFGNGREVRMLWEAIKKRQALRLRRYSQNSSQHTNQALQTIKPEDVLS